MTAPRVAHVTTVDLTARFLLMGQLRRLRDEGYEVTSISAPGPWVGDLEAEGIRHIAWRNATRAWSPGADLRAFLELRRILARERFDLVHTHNPKPGVLGRLAARATGTPCVVNTVHGLYATPQDRLPKRLAVLTAERVARWCSDLELYQSEEDLAWARRIGLVPARKSRLLGNGTDVSVFDPSAVPAERVAALRAELGIPPDAPVVGTVGRLVAEKGYRELFAAARDLREAFPEARVLVLGSGDADKADTLKEADLAAVAPNVVLAGWRKDVRDLLAVMDVFVLASWREGVPRSAIEAAAMGRAMVLTDIRGCREVVRHGREGLLVPPRDPRALGEAILALLADPARRRAIGEAALARALARFDERRVLDTIVDSYRTLLARLGVAPPGGAEAGLRVRSGRVEDAPALARLHRESMPGAFLPSLGDGFMRRVYRALAEDPRAVLVVAENGAGPVGFASGVTSVRSFYRRFYRRHGIAAVVRAAPRLLRPSVLRRVRETAHYPQGSGTLPDAELLSIAVGEGARGRGLGGTLARGILEGLADRGAPSVKVVVGADNEPANRLYGRLGFGHAGRIAVHDGIASNVWIHPWHSSSPSVSDSS